jgi:serine phosphatase RsbU (regulator of sigma subunit)/catechol 2,3-dioxygenase-like lactoylglutathione lyase family enzyme
MVREHDPRFQFATVMVRDQDRSLRFYVDQLGFRLVADEQVPSAGRWAVVEPSDRSVLVVLVTPPDSSDDCRRIGQHTGLVLVTTDIDALFEEWSRRGVSFPQPPAQTSWEGRQAIFEDVDGNRFSLIEYGPITAALEAERRAAAEKAEAERLLARELQIAKEVQARLFQQATPVLETLEYAGVCIPARQVGGDYYDFLELRPGQTALVLADIAGKGISGALLMANLQANLRSQFAILAALKEFFPLALDDFRQLLISVNRLFHENSGDSGYATLFLGNYDDATRRLSYVNCGHPPPVLLHNGGEPFAVERLASTSTVIGLFPTLECNVVEKQFAPGDTLIVYSDGLTEAENIEGEPFGEDRLVEIACTHCHLSPPLLLEKIVEGAKLFSCPEQADDITLVVARCR